VKLGQLLVVSALVGLPVWLLLRVWRRYVALRRAATPGSLQETIGAALLTLSASLWIAILALMILEDYAFAARALAQNLSVLKLGILNLFLCLGGFICSRLADKSPIEKLSFRRALGLASICLLLVWLLFMSNLH
jgi:hypothetical protein